MNRAIILAGGFGTRLQSVVSDRPKALAEVAGKPFIEHQLEWLIGQGITEVTLAVHHMADQIQRFVDHQSSEKITVDTVYENQPLGTGGAVTNVIQQKGIVGKVLVINGDTLFNFSLSQATRFMENRNESVMLIASMMNNVSRFGTIKIENNYVISFQQATGKEEPGVVNCGAYLINASLFANKNIEQFSLEYDLFPELAENKQLIAFTIQEGERFYDIGTPCAYKKICKTDNAF